MIHLTKVLFRISLMCHLLHLYGNDVHISMWGKCRMEFDNVLMHYRKSGIIICEHVEYFHRELNFTVLPDENFLEKVLNI